MSSIVQSGVVISAEGVAVTVAADIAEIVAATGRIPRLSGIFISQSSDVGDAAEEMIRWRHVWGNTSSGSGGSSPDSWDTGYGEGGAGLGSWELFNTTAASGGSPVAGVASAFNIRVGEQIWFPPGFEPRLFGDDGGGELNVIRMMAAPADSLTMTAALFFPTHPDA